MTHVLIVSESPDPDSYAYNIECPGVTNECRTYRDCLASQDEIDALNDLADQGNPAVAHGVEHRHIDGVWMAATDDCYVQTHDGLPDAVAGYFLPGRHSITWDVGDGTDLYVHAADEAVPFRG